MVWPHEGSPLTKKVTRNSDFSRPAETDPYMLGKSSKNKNLYITVSLNVKVDSSPPYGQVSLFLIVLFSKPSVK